jgi:hypothetical protein
VARHIGHLRSRLAGKTPEGTVNAASAVNGCLAELSQAVLAIA